MTAHAFTVGAVAAGVLLVTVLYTGLFKVDRSWRPQLRSCVPCGKSWFGTDKLCRCCGGRGDRGPLPPASNDDGRHVLRADRRVIEP